MNDPAIKKRLARARRLAAVDLLRAGYGIIETQGEPFSIIAVRQAEARFVRVVVDEASNSDVRLCQKYDVPNGCIREVWTLSARARAFQIRSI